MWIGNEATEMRDIFPFIGGRIPDRSILSIEGPEAGHFLHNLVTADITGLSPGEARYTALLTPQGKILFDFFVFRDETDTFLIDCATSQSAELMKRLMFYKLRSKVTISLTQYAAGVSLGEPDAILRYVDPRLALIGWRFVLQQHNKSIEYSRDIPIADWRFIRQRDLGAIGYDNARISLGLADSDADLGSGEYFPHEANLDQLGGVDFAKGCYVGQEVVSRMEHRGTARSRILPIELDGEAPAKGTEIRAGEKLIGTMLSSSGALGLALLRLDRLGEATGPLLTGGVSLRVLKPRWARYDVPGSQEIA